MSGVFGIADPRRRIAARPLADQIAVSLSHRDWYVAEHTVAEEHNVALGRIGIGIFNATPQPVWNAAHTIALVMAGEIYNRDALRQQRGQSSDEQLALDVYEEVGEDFARRLNGAFIVAIWDTRRQQIVIANDRFGLYPLFYACRAGSLIFAPEMKGVLCDTTLPRELDLTAMAQYMRFQHLLGERTFFQDIQLLPTASTLVFDLSTAEHRITTYWTFGDIPYRPQIEFDEAVIEAGRLLRCAVKRLSGDRHRPGVYLSGGLDSRTILGMVEKRPVISLTYGTRHCRDVYYAGRIARAVNSEHHWVDLPNGEWVKEYADFHLELTEGFHSWIHAHGISTLPLARQVMEVNLTGWDGGTVMGHLDSIEPLQMHAVDDLALLTRLFYLFNRKYTWPSMTEADEKLLYCEPIGASVRDLAFDSFRAELQPFLDYRRDVRGEYFYINNHCRRLTHNLITFTRSHVEVRFPFFDYDLFDFLYSLPAPVRGHRALYRALVYRETRPLAHIPYDHDELLPAPYGLAPKTYALSVKLKRRFNRHIRPIFHARPTLYADYEAYLRGELHEWAEGILFDRRTTQRGLFNSAFVRALLEHHVSGLEEWTVGKIAPIMTYELMLRRFYGE
ncbi:MAG TPA: asparagine synthase-related protein [Anaerolineae bacterium]|nr:asparagine synthase-related protein [Anaerolineae bacterium]